MQELRELIRQTGNVILKFEHLPAGLSEHETAEYIWQLCGLNIDPKYISTKDRLSRDYGTALAILHRDTVADYFARLLKEQGIGVKSWDNDKPRPGKQSNRAHPYGNVHRTAEQTAGR
jgi:hypothetical protein